MLSSYFVVYISITNYQFQLVEFMQIRSKYKYLTYK